MRKASTLDIRQRIEFASRGFPADTFTVIDFDGDEGISRLYRFVINLVGASADIDLDAILSNGATLTIVDGDERTLIHGIVAEFEQLHQKGGDTYYRALLVPRLWQLSLYRVSEVYVNQTTPQVIETVLQEAGLTTLDYEISLTGKLTPWTHLCQYQETHFAFISRLMERDGIYFYFAQDEHQEKLIITDHHTRHGMLGGNRRFAYQPQSGLRPDEDRAAVLALICRQKQLPQKVVLMDYNYRKPSLELKSEAVVDPRGHGEVILYGEHADDQDEIGQLAAIRAEEFRCRKRTFHGESDIPTLRPGYLFELARHFRAEFNQRYLLIDVEHHGSQAGMVQPEVAAAAGSATSFYRNSFVAIPAGEQFRPERLTPKPRIHGSINAVIDAEGTGKDAELDEHGRYKVRLQFDRAEHGDAKASQWVRMATPYAGADHGMHFPLRKGTEVLLTFIDGDPNRPIIASAVPNMDTPSVVGSANAGTSVVRIVGGLETYIGGPRSQFGSVGARAASDVDVFGANTWETEYGWQADASNTMADGAHKTLSFDNTIAHNKADTITRTKGDATTEVRGNAKTTTHGNTTTETYGNTTATTHGNGYSQTMGATESLFLGNTFTLSLSATESITGGNAFSFNIGLVESLAISGTFTVAGPGNFALNYGGSMELYAGSKWTAAWGHEFKINDGLTEVKGWSTKATGTTTTASGTNVGANGTNVGSNATNVTTNATNVSTSGTNVSSSGPSVSSSAVTVQSAPLTVVP